MNIPRPEYPRPQMARPVWTNLNGQWEFDFDFSDSGKARGLAQAEHLNGSILVPFCPESRLSGIVQTPVQRGPGGLKRPAAAAFRRGGL